MIWWNEFTGMICLLANIDEDTGCPIGVAHVCEFCAVDQNRLGCYCELPNGDELVTTNIFTACPSRNIILTNLLFDG